MISGTGGAQITVPGEAPDGATPQGCARLA